MNVEFLEPAAQELADAIDYYNCELPGLGHIFLDEVQRIIRLIQKFPMAWSPISLHTRRAILKNFPYSVIYHFENSTLYIIALAHHHRKPRYWISRVQDL